MNTVALDQYRAIKCKRVSSPWLSWQELERTLEMTMLVATPWTQWHSQYRQLTFDSRGLFEGQKGDQVMT